MTRISEKLDLFYKEYTLKYLFGLGAIALISITLNLFFYNSVNSQESLGRMINISGKQRMLSQRAAYLVNGLINAPEEDHPTILRALKEVQIELTKNHDSIINGDAEQNIPPLTFPSIKKIYFESPYNLNELFLGYVDHLKMLEIEEAEMLVPENKSLYIINHGESKAILDLLEKVVDEYQIENDRFIAELKVSENIALFLILGVLLFVGLAVFNPMMRTIKAKTNAVYDREVRFKAVMDNTPDAVFSFDSQGKILTVNSSAESILQYSKEQMIGRSITMLMPETRRRRFLETLQSSGNMDDFLLSGSRQELYGIRKDQQKIPIEVIISQIALPTNEIIYYSFVRDITERKEYEEKLNASLKELKVSNEELERFTYTVSHDLKSPLVTINGFVGLLEEGIRNKDDEHTLTSIDFIKNATKTMQKLLNDLLDLSRVGFQKGEYSKLQFNSVIDKILKGLTEQIRVKKAIIDVAADMPWVQVEEIRFSEVFMNLIENSLKYMGDQKSPHISIGFDKNVTIDGEEECVFFVKDNGRGLKPEYCSKVFEIFERIAVDVDGTGVGLAIVKRVIESHGGRIWVESEGLEKGATFFFVIPVLNNDQSLDT